MTILTTSQTDSLNVIQTEIAAVAEKIASTPASELIADLIDKAVAFGLKVLAAFRECKIIMIKGIMIIT